MVGCSDKGLTSNYSPATRTISYAARPYFIFPREIPGHDQFMAVCPVRTARRRAPEARQCRGDGVIEL
jgi:hypothetical protein